MKVKGTRKTVEQVDVSIDPEEVLNSIIHDWIRKLPNLDLCADYINGKGYWEYWTDAPHGSGTTKTYRLATAEEKIVMKGADALRMFARSMDR